MERILKNAYCTPGVTIKLENNNKIKLKGSENFVKEKKL